MAKMAHERLCATDRMKSSEKKELEAVRKPRPSTIRVGIYANLRPAEIVFKNPGYFYWALAAGAFRGGWSLADAEEIGRKAQHICPPHRSSKLWRFDCQLGECGRLVRYDIVKKSAPLSSKPGVLRVKHLDLSLVVSTGAQLDKINKRLVKRIRVDFFPGMAPNVYDYQEFFRDEGNYDLGCREKHCQGARDGLDKTVA